MRSQFFLRFGLIAALLLLAVPAFAHHGWAGNSDKEFEITGTVQKRCKPCGPPRDDEDNVQRSGVGSDVGAAGAHGTSGPKGRCDPRRSDGDSSWPPEPRSEEVRDQNRTGACGTAGRLMSIPIESNGSQIIF
jgi:hypothetical protein